MHGTRIINYTSLVSAEIIGGERHSLQSQTFTRCSQCSSYHTIRYDRDFNVDSKAEYTELHLAHVARN